MAVKLLIFTDLDGSLMEHETYSIAAAATALAELRKRGFTLVMNSSKTAAEMRAIQDRLTLRAPFVCENGAALYFPHDPLHHPLHYPLHDTLGDSDKEGEQQHRQLFGKLRSDWLPAVHALRAEHGFEFEGFADWSLEQIAALTGLDREGAALASEREFSEPILWRSPTSAKALFEAQLQELGLTLLEGGRFLSIQGPHDKSMAMAWMAKQEHEDTITVALGDSPNDTAMLEAANIAVIIKSAKSGRISLQRPKRIIYTKRPGPAGWQDAMTEILAWLDNDQLSTIGR